VAGLQLKPTRLLLYLIEHRERTVPKEELIEAIWPDTYVTESTFTTAIRYIRQALNDDGDAQSLIRTFRGRGYRFVGAVASRRLEATPEDAHQTAGQTRPPEPNHWLQPRHPVIAVAVGLTITLLIATVLFWSLVSETESEPGLTFEER